MYQALYRKYRPKVFSDVYGQEHVTSTLLNELKEGRVSHAYLFTGSRGIGKTTCAKILAKAVNCENSQNGEPCNECEMCRGLDNGSIYDVVEIDAASNNGVDNIRDLREEANYTPTRGKYRVYIIDEVHMLSPGAFNALLKTLEEPPAHVIFILATTEIHKIPATILSRCQRFDFRRINPDVMAKRLLYVAKQENISLDEKAALLIARIADGGMRDALSILDQCAGGEEPVTEKLVSEVAGIAGRDSLYELSSAAADKDSGRALDVISALHRSSYDMERLCTEMIGHFRNFMIVKTVKDSRSLVVCTDDEFAQIEKSAGRFTLAAVIRALDLFQNALAAIKRGSNARIEMEMSFIKLCEPALDTNAEALVQRISALESALKNGAAAAQGARQVQPLQSAGAQQPEEGGADEELSAQEPDYGDAPNSDEIQEESSAPAAQQSRQEEQQEFTRWADLLEEIRKADVSLFGVLSGAGGYTRGGYFLIDSTNPMVRDFIKVPANAKTIRRALYELTGVNYKLGLFRHAEKKESAARDPLEDLISRAHGSVDVDIKD